MLRPSGQLIFQTHQTPPAGSPPPTPWLISHKYNSPSASSAWPFSWRQASPGDTTGLLSHLPTHPASPPHTTAQECLYLLSTTFRLDYILGVSLGRQRGSPGSLGACCPRGVQTAAVLRRRTPTASSLGSVSGLGPAKGGVRQPVHHVTSCGLLWEGIRLTS